MKTKYVIRFKSAENKYQKLTTKHVHTAMDKGQFVKLLTSYGYLVYYMEPVCSRDS